MDNNYKNIGCDLPSIQRYDIMRLILSDAVDVSMKRKLIELYDLFLELEDLDMQYRTEIAVGSSNEAEIYEYISHMKTQKVV